MSHANLADQKAVYFHPSGTVTLPAWLGKFARVKDTLDDGFGKLDVEYLTFDRPGESLVASRAYDSPGPSTLSLLAKESVVSNLYTWDVDWDIDIRKQCTDKPVDHPLNWTMIKRFCKCWPSQLRAENETSINAGDGETVLTVPVTATCRPVIIKPVTVIGLEDLNSLSVSGIPSIAAIRGGNGYVYYPDAVNNGLGITDLDSVEHVIVASTLDGIAYSHDSGVAYVEDTDLPALITVCFGDYSTVLAGGASGLYLSTDGGQSYTLLDDHDLIPNDVDRITTDGSGIFYILDSSYIVYRYDALRGLSVLGLSPLTGQSLDVLYVDGILYLAGFTGINTRPIIIASYDDGLTWHTVYQLYGDISSFDYGDASSTFRLASAGHGVLYATYSVLDWEFNLHTYVIRSVNWGTLGTWETMYHVQELIASDNLFYIPTDIACAGVNDAKVIGINWLLAALGPVFDDYQILTLEG